MKIAFTVDNVDAIRRAYAMLGKTDGAKVIRSALRVAMKPLAAEVKRLTPRDTGVLADSTKVRARKTRKRGQFRIVVMQDKGKRPDGVFPGGYVNFGTKRQTGRHYFEQAVAAEQATVVRIVTSEIETGISKRLTLRTGSKGK